MAKAKAVCTCKKCGKEFVKEVFGPTRKDANSKAEWAAETFDLCSDCWKAEKEEAMMKRAEKLPQLEGSEKQIAWAIKIRDKFMPFLAKAEKVFEAEVAHAKDAKEDINMDGVERMRKAHKRLREMKSARVWIEAEVSHISKTNIIIEVFNHIDEDDEGLIKAFRKANEERRFF